MARNLSKDLKRLVAGLCAVLIVGGAVPLQPLVNFSGTIKAVADGPSSVNVAKTYTKNSPELVDGVRLYKGDTILFEGIKNNRLSVYDPPKYYWTNEPDNITTLQGGCAPITSVTVDSDGRFLVTYQREETNPYKYMVLIPNAGYTFNFTYYPQTNTIVCRQVELDFVRLTSANDLANMTECSFEDAKAWIDKHLNIDSDFAVVYGKISDSSSDTSTSSDNYMVAYKDAGIIKDGLYVASTLETWNNGDIPVYYLAHDVKTAALSFGGFTAGEDYAVENGVTEVKPGDTVTIYTNKRFNTNKDYASADYETADSGYYSYNGKDYKYKCIVEIRNNAYFANDETISFTEQPKVDFEFVDLEDTDYVVVEKMDTLEDDGDNSVYVTEHADIFTKKRIDLDESIFENSTVRFVDCVKEIPEDGFFTVNNEKYLYRYHVTFPNYPYPEGITATFTAEKNVDLEFENIAENKKFAVEGDLPYAYVADGSVIYSDQTLAGNISQVKLQESTTSGGYEYKGETYKYKYDVTYSGDLKTGDTVTFSHVHEYGNPHVDIEEKPDIIIADCTGENGKEVGTVEIAQLKPKDIYYYGDLPTVEEVVVKPEQMPKGITSIDPVSLSIKKKGKTSSQDYFTDFGTYELSTIVNVVCGGKTYPISITKDVEYSPRSLFGAEDSSSTDKDYTGCQFFLRTYEEANEEQSAPDQEVPEVQNEPEQQNNDPQVDNEQQNNEEQNDEQQENVQQQANYSEVPLVVKNGVITLPKDSFVYNKKEQKPVIVVKNSINGTVTELTEEEITSTVEGKTGANKDNEYYEFNISAVQPDSEEAAPANYTGEVTVKWRIEKAPNNVTFVPKTDTVYDAEVLDDTDFTFTDPDDTLNDSNIKVEVKGKETEFEPGTVTATSGVMYYLTSADNNKKLGPVDNGQYRLPDNYTYTVHAKSIDINGEIYDDTSFVTNGLLGLFCKSNGDNKYTWKLSYNGFSLGFANETYTITVEIDDEQRTVDITRYTPNAYQKMLEDMNENYDITSAGVQKGTITIKSDNYQDKVMDFETTIAKKEVTVAPNGIKDNEKNTITWGELIKDSDVLYTQDGVVDKDKPAGGDYNFGLIFTAEGYNFDDASKNNVGEYKLVPSDIFADYNAADNNYLLVLPKEETEEQEELAEPHYMLSTEQGEPGESEEVIEDEPKEETEDVKLDTLTIVPYELTKANVSIVDTKYQFDTYTKNPTVTVTVPYSLKKSEQPESHELSLGTIDDHAGKEAFVKGVRYDNIVGEKNLAVLTDDTTSKNFTAGDKGLEFKWYINNGTLSIEVSDINNKIYDGAAVAEPTVTVTNQINEVVNNASTKIQYQKKDEESGEYGEAFDGEPKDAGTYRAVVTANADSYNEAVEYSKEFTISKREVIVNLFGLPEVNGYNDTAVDYTISEANPDNPDDNTGIINNEVNPEGTVTIKAGKKDGDHITNADLSKIAEALGDNYTFTYDIPLTLRDAKLDRLVVYKAYMDNGETIDPNDYFTAYDENGKDITDQCRVINIDNIDQLGDYTIEVNDGSLDVPLSDILYVLTKVDKVNDLIAELPESEDVTAEDEDAITNACEAYEALTDEQKAKVDADALNKLEDAEEALEDAKKAAAVTEAINALPDAEDVTTEDADDIENARDKYDALTDAQKDLIDEETVDKLEAAETALAAAIEEAEKAAADQTAADAVKQEINDLPAAEDVTTEDADDIENARDKYDALTDAQKDLIDEETVDKLEAAETALAAAIEAAEKAAADEAAANAVRDSINALPETEAVKPEDAEKIAKARDDYNALTAAQKELVDEATLQKLEAAEDALEKANEAAKKAAEDEAAADAVKQAINDLPAAENVTVDDADAIAAVREAFEALTDDQKGMVDGDTMKKLDDAEAALDTAKKAAEKAAEDQAAADAVKNAINALPAAEDLTKDDAEAIANARKLFDNLTDDQKALIDPEVIKKLTDGEAAVAAISEFIKGDVNGDGKININDLTKIAAHVKGKKLLTEEEQMRADVNGDGKLDINDISKIAAHIKGKRLI